VWVAVALAEQPQDDSLRMLAVRIQGRAVKRAGELLGKTALATGKNNQHAQMTRGADRPLHSRTYAAGRFRSRASSVAQLRRDILIKDALRPCPRSELLQELHIVARQRFDRRVGSIVVLGFVEDADLIITC
jgi:hypothetical protein